MKFSAVLLFLALTWGLTFAHLSPDSLAFTPTNPAFAEYDRRYADLEEIFQAIKASPQASVPEVARLIQLIEHLKVVANDPATSRRAVDPDTFRSIPEIIRDKGYPAEEHLITTDDGFLINIFRIPHGLNTTRGGPPVLLSHGLIDTAGSWVLNYPHQSLPYLLADAGYDVWLGNVRGNRYGDEHERFGRWNAKLWAHSYDEHGKYDIPNTIDYIRGNTKYDKVSVVGHSQGCTQLFSGFYHNDGLDKLANKINIFFALAPAVHFEHNSNLIIHFAAHIFLGEFLQLIGIKKCVPLHDSTVRLFAHVCDAAPELIEAILGTIMGYNPGEINYARFSVMCYHFLGWTSTQNMVHWAQMVRTEEFNLHDYGSIENLVQYGRTDPPPYNINKSYPKEVPIAVWYGTVDELVSQGDSEKLIAELPVAPIFTKHIPQCAHMDFVHGQNARKNAHDDDLIDLLKKQVPVLKKKKKKKKRPCQFS